MNRLHIVLVASLLAACSSDKPEGEDDDDGGPIVGGGDPTAITIEIETPERGTLSDASELVVTGRVTSTAGVIESVTVNGSAAQLAGDRFEAPLSLVEGITLIETHVRDAAGNESIDARGVMSGTLVDQSSPVTDGVVASVSSQATGGLTSMLADIANSTDFNTIIRDLNPIATTGGDCPAATIFVNSVEHGGVSVAATNVAGGLDADITIATLVATGEVELRVAAPGPIPGCSPPVTVGYTLTADSYDLGAVIVPSLSEGSIAVALENVGSDFQNFDVDVNGVPGFVEDLFNGTVKTRLANTLRDQVSGMLPTVVNSFLGDFLADSFSIDLLGQTIQLAIEPTAMTWTDQGGTVALNTSAIVSGLQGASYISTPRTRPSDADLVSTGLRVALADDVLNQLLASIWASGALDQTMLRVPGDALSAALGAEVASAHLTMILPPVANFDTTTGTARLTAGDLLLEAIGPDGEDLASFVLAAEIELAVETGNSGNVRLVTRAPRILAQVLSQSDTLAAPLTADLVAAIAELGITQVSVLADDLLQNLPIPGLSGATITSPTLQPAGGYLLLGGALTFE